jgi:hypothetical protein
LLLQTEAVGLVQSALLSHCTHVLTAALPAAAPSLVVLQTAPSGLPTQWLSLTHSTQPTFCKHAPNPVKAPQSLSSEHTAQSPFWHLERAGLLAQSPLLMQLTQMPPTVLHKPGSCLLPPQSALSIHPTQE